MNQTGVTRLGMEVECETLTISDVLRESMNGRSGRHMDLDPGKAVGDWLDRRIICRPEKTSIILFYFLPRCF